MSTYLLINIAALVLPFLLSFDRKVGFYRKWKYLFPAILIQMAVFIPWDVWFTRKGIWGFNPQHLSGLYIFDLPVEEWMFFIFISYASVFTFEVVIVYFKRDFGRRMPLFTSIILLGLFFLLVFLNYDRLYTLITLSLSIILIIYHQFIRKSWYLGKFYFSYLLVLFPFMIVNGLLTGSFLDSPVVWYHDMENMGWRLFTIPVEDTTYGFNMILLTVTFYQILKKRIFSS